MNDKKILKSKLKSIVAIGSDYQDGRANGKDCHRSCNARRCCRSVRINPSRRRGRRGQRHRCIGQNAQRCSRDSCKLLIDSRFPHLARRFSIAISSLFSWQQNAEGTITFKLIPSESQRPSRENRVRVRALFDFTAALDRYIVSLSSKKSIIVFWEALKFSAASH